MSDKPQYKPRDCPCVIFESPICHPHCWHFGNDKDICKLCGQGFRPETLEEGDSQWKPLATSR